jgi:D-alanyl-D-alanine carboxypeptidase
LPSSFAPGENAETRAAFEQMAIDARVAGFELVAFSTYRSYEYQETLYNNYVSRDGQENADRYSARPGYSEHQTGLAFDVGEKGKEDLWLTDEFGETEAGKWLVENAHKYGFILRYPQGKEAITGYMYESWHFRYLGVDLATKVKQSNLTLEEYLGIE